MNLVTVSTADLERILNRALDDLNDRTDYMNGPFAIRDYGEEFNDAVDELSRDWAAYRRLTRYSPDAD